MKALFAVFVSAVAFSVASPAFAFRYEWQTLQIRQAMARKHERKLAQARKGAVQPAPEKLRAGRPEPSSHP